ncbi:MAG: biotin--[acetyl-CoA-carboxylase] ligase [Pseudopedobacter saltans]|uniref:Biotin--[acetyl-CoA-carboxylase] ligase n=1 Tax=Pseudopedobacter saltans TaxID=151895 RepID=A0A2W5EYT4_9SPHI|nr:MAG: biotin--[acetyl-CoA-carboxylase] ligase [Pseudopedobacter saltans]
MPIFASKIVILLPTSHTIGQSFIELREADSTNNYAMAAAKDNDAFHGLAWYTNNQTSGRGQRGHSWSSKPGENLALSVLLDTSAFSLTQQFSIIVLAALSVYDLLRPFGKENLKIKWPNDIYFNDKKAVGILTESVIKGQIWQWTVVGIGINVNQSSFDDFVLSKKATSLFQETGVKMDTRELAQLLCEKLEYRWQQMLQYGSEAQLLEYNHYLFQKGKIVSYKRKTGNILECEIDHVDAAGRLHVLEGENEESFSFGEVELISSQKK